MTLQVAQRSILFYILHARFVVQQLLILLLLLHLSWLSSILCLFSCVNLLSRREQRERKTDKHDGILHTLKKMDNGQNKNKRTREREIFLKTSSHASYFHVIHVTGFNEAKCCTSQKNM